MSLGHWMRGSGVRTKDDRISLLNYYRASKTVPESLRIQSTKRTATVTRQRSEDIKPVFWLPLPSLKRYSFTMRHSWVLQDGAPPLTTHHACVASIGLDGMSRCLLKSRKLSRGYPASHHLLENKLLISFLLLPSCPPSVLRHKLAKQRGCLQSGCCNLLLAPKLQTPVHHTRQV